MFPLNRDFNYSPSQPIGDFFSYNIHSINFTMNDSNKNIYEDLSSLLDHFVLLKNIYIKDNGYQITYKQAARLITAINSNHRTLTLHSNQQTFQVLLEAFYNLKPVNIKLKLISIDQQQQTPAFSSPSSSAALLPVHASLPLIPKKRSDPGNRTPSPLRKALKSTTDSIMDQLDILKKNIKSSSFIYSGNISHDNYINNDNDNSIIDNHHHYHIIGDNYSNIPSNLQPIIKNPYKKLNANELPALSVPTNKLDVDFIMKQAAPFFIESILVSDSSWCFVTQFELYVRDLTDIDDCAVVQEYPYPQTPIANINKKTDRGKVWKELSIFWGRYELLVTGGLYGSKSGVDGVNAFLGSTLPNITSSFNMDKMTILTSIKVPEVVQRERRLRNYSNMASTFFWSFHSKMFFDKGYKTTHPLHIHLDIRENNDQSSLSSLPSFNQSIHLNIYLIKKIIEGNINKMEINRAIEIFKSGSARSLCPVSTSDNPFISLTTDDICSLYNLRLASHCTSKDKKNIQRKLYLF
ncbi:unnamed protein product [Cunninghamella echinulata]